MKSYLMMVADILLMILEKLFKLLKTGCIRLMKNRKLCKNILLVMLFVLTWIMGARYGANHVEIPEPEIVPMYGDSDPDIAEMMSQYRIQRAEKEENLSAIAKVLYGYRYNSERDLEGIVWVILNRMDNQSEFRDFNTIQEVVNQPSQWMGYTAENPVLENLWNIAESTLYKYETDGKRLFGQEYLYFEWRSDYITFKTELNDSNTCKRWRAY